VLNPHVPDVARIWADTILLSGLPNVFKPIHFLFIYYYYFLG